MLSRMLAILACFTGATPAIALVPPLPPGDPLAQSISAAPLDSESAAVIGWLASQGWGLGRMQIDFSIEVNEAPPGTPTIVSTERPGYYLPDCERSVLVPTPSGGAIEGVSGYQCSGGDCHLIVFDTGTRVLYEAWLADISGGVLRSQCLVKWELDKVYPPERRGWGCTSADAAGLPIAPLLFDADEVASGAINHAIRFILPNARIRTGYYVSPATHVGSPSGPPSAPPYGARLRLRADYPLTMLPNDAARTVARAMQRYGIVLADGGNVALTARSDRFTAAKWSGLLGPRDLDRLQVSDFQMVEAGERHIASYDCERAPPPLAPPSPTSQQVPFGRVPLAVLAALLALAAARSRID